MRNAKRPTPAGKRNTVGAKKAHTPLRTRTNELDKQKERWRKRIGWSSVGGPYEPRRHSFNDEARDEILKTLPGIKREEENAAIAEIEEAAALYVGYSPTPKSRQIRDNLKRGRKIATQLYASLGELSEWLATLDLETRDYLLSGAPDVAGINASKWGIRHAVRWLDLVCVNRITAIKQAIDNALQPKDSSGPKGHIAVRSLIEALAKIWERYTKRPFNRETKGQSTPRDFVRVVCQHLIPNDSVSIENQMKEFIKSRRGDNRDSARPN